MEINQTPRDKNQALSTSSNLRRAITLLRLVPHDFVDTLHHIKRVRSRTEKSFHVSSKDIKTSLEDFWIQENDNAFRERRSFLVDDLSELGRHFALGADADQLQVTFHTDFAPSQPFMTHDGLRLIYDTIPTEDAWALFRIDGQSAKLSPSAFFIDLVTTGSVVSEASGRGSVQGTRDEEILEQLYDYQHDRTRRYYAGMSEISPQLIAKLMEVTRIDFIEDTKEAIKKNEREEVHVEQKKHVAHQHVEHKKDEESEDNDRDDAGEENGGPEGADLLEAGALSEGAEKLGELVETEEKDTVEKIEPAETMERREPVDGESNFSETELPEKESIEPRETEKSENLDVEEADKRNIDQGLEFEPRERDERDRDNVSESEKPGESAKNEWGEGGGASEDEAEGKEVLNLERAGDENGRSEKEIKDVAEQDKNEQNESEVPESKLPEAELRELELSESGSPEPKLFENGELREQAETENKEASEIEGPDIESPESRESLKTAELEPTEQLESPESGREVSQGREGPEPSEKRDDIKDNEEKSEHEQQGSENTSEAGDHPEPRGEEERSDTSEPEASEAEGRSDAREDPEKEERNEIEERSEAENPEGTTREAIAERQEPTAETKPEGPEINEKSSETGRAEGKQETSDESPEQTDKVESSGPREDASEEASEGSENKSEPERERPELKDEKKKSESAENHLENYEKTEKAEPVETRERKEIEPREKEEVSEKPRQENNGPEPGQEPGKDRKKSGPEPAHSEDQSGRHDKAQDSHNETEKTLERTEKVSENSHENDHDHGLEKPGPHHRENIRKEADEKSADAELGHKANEPDNHAVESHAELDAKDGRTELKEQGEIQEAKNEPRDLRHRADTAEPEIGNPNPRQDLPELDRSNDDSGSSAIKDDHTIGDRKPRSPEKASENNDAKASNVREDHEATSSNRSPQLSKKTSFDREPPHKTNSIETAEKPTQRGQDAPAEESPSARAQKLAPSDHAPAPQTPFDTSKNNGQKANTGQTKLAELERKEINPEPPHERGANISEVDDAQTPRAATAPHSKTQNQALYHEHAQKADSVIPRHGATPKAGNEAAPSKLDRPGDQTSPDLSQHPTRFAEGTDARASLSEHRNAPLGDVQGEGPNMTNKGSRHTNLAQNGKKEEPSIKLADRSSTLESPIKNLEPQDELERQKKAFEQVAFNLDRPVSPEGRPANIKTERKQFDGGVRAETIMSSPHPANVSVATSDTVNSFSNANARNEGPVTSPTPQSIQHSAPHGISLARYDVLNGMRGPSALLASTNLEAVTSIKDRLYTIMTANVPPKPPATSSLAMDVLSHVISSTKIDPAHLIAEALLDNVRLEKRKDTKEITMRPPNMEHSFGTMFVNMPFPDTEPDIG